jgi:LuxR family maltose regulon positive regulatory protein
MRWLEREKIAGVKAIPTVAPFLARIYLIQGRLHAAAALSREFLDPLKASGARFIATAGDMEIALGEALLEWNCLEEAERCIRSGLQANAPWGNIMTEAFGLVALARLLAVTRDFAGALQAVDQFEARLQGDVPPREFSVELRTLRTSVWLAMGDLQKAADWAEQIRRSEDYRLHPELYRLALARIHLAQGEYTEAEKLLDGKELPPAPYSLVTRQLEVSLLLAAASAGQQRLPQALDCLEDCLALAEPEGYVRVFLDAGAPVQDLLAAYLRLQTNGLRPQEPGHKPFARKILAAIPPAARAALPGSPLLGLVEPLSGRELEVLQLMASGKTNQEIALRLVVAPGTIKAHAASIYRKLDAANRTEAVARARQLCLLD